MLVWLILHRNFQLQVNEQYRLHILKSYHVICCGAGWLLTNHWGRATGQVLQGVLWHSTICGACWIVICEVGCSSNDIVGCRFRFLTHTLVLCLLLTGQASRTCLNISSAEDCKVSQNLPLWNLILSVQPTQLVFLIGHVQVNWNSRPNI